MAVFGAQSQALRANPLYFSLFWFGCVVLLGVAFYTALLDIRYIRMQYAMAKRELFFETLGVKQARERLDAASAAAEQKDSRKQRTNGKASRSSSSFPTTPPPA